MIKIISFDIGGTLLEFDELVGSYNIKSLSNLINLSYDEVKRVYKDVFQKTKGSFDNLVTLFCNKLGIKVSKQIQTFFRNKFYNSETKRRVSKEKINLIKKLKNDGYKVILFSNSCCLLDNSSIMEITNLVDNIFYSYDLGYTKNENESYKLIEQLMQANSCEFLHIGDTLNSDYFMPINNGWNALYYGENDDITINSINCLKDVYKFLEKNRVNKISKMSK